MAEREDKKKSFILYESYAKAIDRLPDAKAGKLFKLLFKVANGEEPKIEDVAIGMAFDLMSDQLKRDKAKWEETKVGRSKGGLASGVARRKNKKEQTGTNRTNVHLVEQKGTKRTVNVTDNVNVIGTVNGNEKVNGNGVLKQPPHTTKAYSNLKYFEEHQGFSITPEPSETLRETFDRYLLGRALGQHGPIQSYIQIEEILRGFYDLKMNEETMIKVLKANIKNGWKNIQYNAVDEDQKPAAATNETQSTPKTWN